MFNGKKKIGNNLGAKKTESRLLRLLRSDTGFQACLMSLERTDQEDDYNACAQKEIGNAMLEVEYKKAKAIMMMQQHRNFC